MNNTNLHTIIVPSQNGLFRSLQYISEQMAQRSKNDRIILDLSEVSFELSAEFFTVLRKRYSQYHITCVIDRSLSPKAFEGFGFPIDRQRIRTEFDKEFAKKHILRHNFTIFEYFWYEMRRGIEFLRYALQGNVSQKPTPRAIKIDSSRTGGLFLILTGLIVSISLLLFIFYFAVSKTIVLVEPQVAVRSVNANINFVTEAVSGSIINPKQIMMMYRESAPVEVTQSFPVTAIDTNSVQNSRGTITVFNELTTKQALKGGTRFLSEDGVIYRAEGAINIPPTRTVNGVTQIGSTEIRVVADPIDITGKTVGDRGNITEGINLSIPALKNNRDKIYGRSKGDFSGGKNPLVHILTKEEYERSVVMIREHAKKVALDTLNQMISEKNKQTPKSVLTLLMADTIRYTDESIEILDGVQIGSATNEMKLKIKLKISALYYDQTKVMSHLQEVFHSTLIPGTDKELGVSPKIRITNIGDRKEDDSEIKLTMETDATVTYDLENPASDRTRQMKIIIAGLDRDTARDRLMDTGYVKDITIKFSPFWMSRVANNMDNIEFVIRK